MILNVFQLFDSLEKSLNDYFQSESNPFVFKGSENPEEFIPARPFVYKFLVPVCDRNDQNFPQKIPSIALILDDLGEENGLDIASISAHIAVVCPSISDKETIVFDQEKQAYVFKETDEYTQSQAYHDLYSQCLLLANETRCILQKFEETRYIISDMSLNPPDSSMPDFPFSTCSISFKISIRQSYRTDSPDFTKYL